jgi:MFS family permease
VPQDPPPASLLRDARFRTLWATVEISFLGMFVHVVAGGWLMTGLTSSVLFVSLIQTAYALPMVVFSVLAGAIADTMDRRGTMIWSLLVSLVASAALALLAFLDLLTPWAILGLIFAVGAGTAVFTPSWQATLGDIVPRDRLVEAVSLHNMGANAMRTVGPALGGMLVASAGAPVAFAVGTASYVPALAVMLARKGDRMAGKDRERFRSAMLLGFRFLAVSPHVQLVLVRVFCFSVGAICVMAILPLVARDQLGQGASAYGFLFAGYGLGAIAGGLCMKHLRRHLAVETIVRGAFVLTAVAMAVLAISGSLWTALPATVAAGSAWLTVHSLQNTTLQLATPRWIVGRMVAMFLSSAFLGLAVGGWLWGVVAEAAGTRGALGFAALAALGTFLLALRLPLPDTAGLAPEPLDGAGIADDADDAHRVGPLHIMIDHRIDTARTPEFMTLMEKRRRHLTRLGARHWTLLRDIRRAGRWTESFETEGWADYRRMMGRRTAETAALRKAAVDLQTDGAEFRVRLMIRTSPVERAPAPPMLRA